MSKVAPANEVMDREALHAKYGAFELEAGAKEFVTMKDGWKLQRETWTPTDVPPRAVLLYLHGGGSSTRTLSVRRFAHAYTKRGIILETFDHHGHGESMEKNGKPFANKKFQGYTVETNGALEQHAVEMAELVQKQHAPLPLSLIHI